MEAMRILYIAYPLLTVSPESAGGAEQVLWTVEREMAARGVTTSVAASLGSQVSGELVATGEPCNLPDDFERRNREHHDRVIQLIGERTGSGAPFDLIHDMSASFWPHAREVELPVLATLHLPRHFYSSQLFENIPANVSFNCVSRSQAQCFADLPRLEGVVANGIALESFTVNAGGTPRRGALWLGRICEEKAPHLAIEIAEEAGWSLTLAGQVYPFSYHRAYFERAIAPRLRVPGLTFIDSPSIGAKRALLRDAEALLITSQVEETSSLVAMEAAASGTPVIAFRRGALSEVVQEGVTGFLVDGVEQAVHALRRVAEIEANACARHAALHYSSAAMARGYWQLYQRIFHGWTSYGPDLQDDKSSISAV